MFALQFQVTKTLKNNKSFERIKKFTKSNKRSNSGLNLHATAIKQVIV
jgi:hypothetical protein